MATRCTIEVEGITSVKFYIHYDGYPSHILPWLEYFNKDFESNRTNDPQYKFAQLIRSSVFLKDKFNLSDDRYLGHGVVSYDHDDYSYNYVLKADGTVTYENNIIKNDNMTPDELFKDAKDNISSLNPDKLEEILDAIYTAGYNAGKKDIGKKINKTNIKKGQKNEKDDIDTRWYYN